MRKNRLAADDHVPAVAPVDPQRVLIVVDAVGAVGFEGLAAVLRTIQPDAASVDVFLIAGIDTNLAEIHGPHIEAVDARPAVATVGRFVDAAVIEAFRSLLVLDVLRWPPYMKPKGRSPRLLRTTETSSVSLPRWIVTTILSLGLNCCISLAMPA